MPKALTATFLAFLAMSSHRAFAQATAPAPRPAPQGMPQSNLPEKSRNTQASAPGGDIVTGATTVVSVRLDTLKQVLAMALSDEEVKKIAEFENAKFGHDYSAMLVHRRSVLAALIAKLKENCK